MIIESLSLTDFRVFQGLHHFELAPKKRWNASRPIILFGGLNGAGKTTVLTAVRLVLYGKQSLGAGTSQKNYHDFLRKSIHKSRDSVLQSNHSNITLCFDYSHMGVSSRFEIKRSWSVTDKKVEESIEIARDSKNLKDLTYDQKQGFLNELIPIGVSDLFFFDGEKIAELAKDQTGSALSDSIKKLLGLDLIDKLNSDLGVLIRNQSRTTADKAKKEKIDVLELDLSRAEALAEGAEDTFRSSVPELTEAKAKLAICERTFLASGGAYAVTRDQEKQKQEALLANRSEVQDKIRKLLSGTYPLILAETFVRKTLEKLHHENDDITVNKVKDAQEALLDKLQQSLKAVLAKPEYDKSLSILESCRHIDNVGDVKKPAMHNVGMRTLASFESQFREADGYARSEIEALAKQLADINLELDQIGERITRAPDEGTLKTTVEDINEQRNNISVLNAKIESYREEAKRYIREAIEIARQLDTLHGAALGEESSIKTVELAHKAQNTLSEFARNAAEQKISTLEIEFTKCFHLLARKDDTAISAKIDSKSFKVTLLDRTGNELDKDDLSAGEKQIYAIAMLEALARTSGRKLPIIIDTPLGRLDSKHRTNLVHNYFPKASHQVLILSTDTEIDESFYEDLYKNMSRAYKLEYNPETGSTTAEKGYFWRSTMHKEVA